MSPNDLVMTHGVASSVATDFLDESFAKQLGPTETDAGTLEPGSQLVDDALVMRLTTLSIGSLPPQVHHRHLQAIVKLQRLVLTGADARSRDIRRNAGENQLLFY